MSQTSLYNEHCSLGAKIVDFHGWELPIWYQSAKTEHLCVREKVGLFDVSHMGEITAEGPEAAQFLEYVTVGNISRLDVGNSCYTLMCNEQGGIIDDLIVYRTKPERYLLVVNGANCNADWAWIEEHGKKYKHLKLKNESDDWSQIAIQGPNAKMLIHEIWPNSSNIEQLGFTELTQDSYQNQSILISRTGYTGELGFEIYLPNKAAPSLWQHLLEFKHLGVQPAGLSARDSLRLEACFPLHGNDIDAKTTPLEAGLGWCVRKEGFFIGSEALAQEKEQGTKRKLVAFSMLERAVPRSGMPAQIDSQLSGTVTSGGFLPSLNQYGGLAFLPKSTKIGSEFAIDVRGTMKRAVVVKKPFYATRAKG